MSKERHALIFSDNASGGDPVLRSVLEDLDIRPLLPYQLAGQEITVIIVERAAANALTVITNLRKQERFSRLPILVLLEPSERGQASGFTLHKADLLFKPVTDKALRRTAMDYGKNVEIVRHDGWSAFFESNRLAGRRLVLFSTRAEASLEAFAFRPDDCLLFGRESAGVPEDVHQAADARVRIPLAADARSLNVAMTAGIALWEGLKQTGQLPGPQS